jgi:hypothetical protein
MFSIGGIMDRKIISHIVGVFSAIILAGSIAQAQGIVTSQDIAFVQEKVMQQPPVTPTVLAAYAKWRTDTLLNYPQGLLTPHYAVAIVAQRLDDNTAQVELLLAADMKHYTITIKPVTLASTASGETESKVAGTVVTIDQKSGEKLANGADTIRLGQTMTLVPVTKAVQALEITWTPKNDNKDDFANTCIIQLGKEPTVTVNGYILGAPVK